MKPKIDSKAAMILTELDSLISNVRFITYLDFGERSISLASGILSDLGGPDQAGQRLDLFLQALANGNPDNLGAVRSEALACLTREMPKETEREP